MPAGGAVEQALKFSSAASSRTQPAVQRQTVETGGKGIDMMGWVAVGN
jgi:hypothetical protein